MLQRMMSDDDLINNMAIILLKIANIDNNVNIS
jgi:hypothetical protein